MAEAATSLMDRKILAIASESAGDHEQFGVIDPLSPKLEVGQKGVGTHVTISDIHDKPLVDLIIGRAVKDATNDQHYVREANRDVVYIVEVDPTKLSTNFDDWIEKDLLKLNAWDIQQVQINDYSAELAAGDDATRHGDPGRLGPAQRAQALLRRSEFEVDRRRAQTIRQRHRKLHRRSSSPTTRSSTPRSSTR